MCSLCMGRGGDENMTIVHIAWFSSHLMAGCLVS